MDFLLSFAIGFFLNEGRFLQRIFSQNLMYIKNKIIIKEFGYHYLLLLNLINFCKGFIVIYLLANNYSNIQIMFLIICLVLGLYLGSKPVYPEGSELVIFLGVIAGYDLETIKILTAILFSLIILTKNIKGSFFIIVLLNSIFLIKYNIFLSCLALLLIANYLRYNCAHFSLLFNIINKKINIFPLKGVKSLYESIIYSFTKVFKKCFEKGF